MDFFQSQDAARKKTKGLVFLFGIAVVLIVASVYVTAMAVFKWLGVHTTADVAALDVWDPAIFILSAGLTLSVIGFGSLYKTLALREGGEAVARMLGGRPINLDSRDPDERRLLNVVEEMAIASGLPVPDVYVLEREGGINAFAAGRTPGDAVIGVTRGGMQLLSRDELQGVIGHEFSHILNGDMRLNLRLMGVLHGILVIALIGYWVLRSAGRGGGGRSRGKGGGQIFILGLALLIIGYVGLFFGRLIKAAVSRQREYLADAAAVQFTRYPEGLAGALRKIGGHVAGSRLQASSAEEASHLYFSQGVRTFLTGLLATHPPLADRIHRIDPRFAGEFPVVNVERVRAALRAEDEHPAVARMAAPAGPRLRMEPRKMVERVGIVDTKHIEYARQILSELPEALTEAAHEPLGAQAVVFGLLLDREPARREGQLQILEEAVETLIHQETVRVLPLVDQASEVARLPLLDLVMPALRRLSEEQYRDFYAAVRRLVTSDEQIGLFEYALQQVLVRHLRAHFEKKAQPLVKYKSMHPVREHCSVVLSALAYHGGVDGAILAFQQGAQALGKTGKGLALEMPAHCELRDVDRALRELALLAPELKKQVVEACAATITYDRMITDGEAELLRAISASLECPMPPFVPGMEI